MNIASILYALQNVYLLHPVVEELASCCKARVVCTSGLGTCIAICAIPAFRVAIYFSSCIFCSLNSDCFFIAVELVFHKYSLNYGFWTSVWLVQYLADDNLLHRGTIGRKIHCIPRVMCNPSGHTNMYMYIYLSAHAHAFGNFNYMYVHVWVTYMLNLSTCIFLHIVDCRCFIWSLYWSKATWRLTRESWASIMTLFWTEVGRGTLQIWNKLSLTVHFIPTYLDPDLIWKIVSSVVVSLHRCHLVCMSVTMAICRKVYE